MKAKLNRALSILALRPALLGSGRASCGPPSGGSRPKRRRRPSPLVSGVPKQQLRYTAFPFDDLAK